MSGAAGPGANLTALRSHNAALVLRLLRDAGEDGVSRPELAGHTGLTPQAVSKITARLRTEGLAVEAGQRASTGGKPPAVLRLVPGARHAIGLHLDRDELTAVLVDLAGTPVAARTAPFDFGAGAEQALTAATAEVRALLADACTGLTETGTETGGATGAAAGGGLGGGLLGVGVAAPGPLDHGSGVLHRVTGFPQWDGFPLRDALAERLGLPVVLDKDTNAAALGLVTAGTAPSAAYLHLGTGLGAGLMLGGEVYRGARTDAGEFGHQVIQLDGPPCACGNRGCLEALCLAAVARDDHADAARLLGVGAANLVRLLDIDRVLLGGRVVLADPEPYVRGVATMIAEDSARASRLTVPVDVVERGGRAVVEGAARLVLAPLFALG
ncbi:ROK family transcriptional regulator [Streptomyces violaceusniger]|uniref:ROK family transcriptional regulator n=3 Tax=Streptomyces TaxID=1883 RepID=A0ABD5J2F5_9ACTN|nr:MULTISPECIES: ROK family transcriptional regulator [Streptomyces]MEE4582421.1 ROK family transcriptional regulator [Streptomyces sp. DSM 41602]KUL60653.1 ROK family transcriptional regulator [Streptomyces violaceusniger]QTI90838.1 ROK family transcriptional regulator [Streptomyces sp. AgN23]WTA87104.1 ROK family transcriptional regulator [Streptomyces antimycoticus]WTB11654.1 ROK family transcriptional regulator [Streptomyces antimycoticus]